MKPTNKKQNMFNILVKRKKKSKENRKQLKANLYDFTEEIKGSR